MIPLNIKHRISRNRLFGIVFFLLIGYFMQGILYPTGSIISQTFLLMYLIIGGVSFLVQFGKLRQPLPIGLWMLFCIVQIVTYLVSPKMVYGRLYEAIGAVSTFGQVKNILTFCLSLFVGMRVGAKGFNLKTIACLGFVLLGIACLRYFYTQESLLALRKVKATTNNASYNFVLLLPFVPIMFKYYKRLTIAAVFIIIGFVIAGAKRGAIVCLAAALIFILFWILLKQGVTIKRLVLTIIAVAAISIFAVEKYQENEYLQQRMDTTEKKGFGGREIAYVILLKHWMEDTNPFTQFFGNGSTQTVGIWGNYAHNDWLEILIDNGLLGVLLYAGFFLSAIYYIKRSPMLPDAKLSCYLFLIIWFGKSIFSMGYSNIWSSFSMILLGLYWGAVKYRKIIALN